jgi:hypothetical protein
MAERHLYLRANSRPTPAVQASLNDAAALGADLVVDCAD